MRAPRLDFIDGLRGAACLYVVLYHAFLLWPVSGHLPGGDVLLLQLLTKVAAYGYLGVDVFLALSGFSLAYPLCRRTPNETRHLPSVPLGTYAVRRARRILPPYLAAVALFSVLPLWDYWAKTVGPTPTFLEIASHVLLIHNLFPATILRIDGPLWSLALEAQLYVLFPVLVWFLRRSGFFGFGAALLVGTLGFRFFAWVVLGAESLPFEARFALMGSLPARIFEFAVGMLAAVALAGRDGVAPMTRWIRVLGYAAVTLAPVAGYVADKRGGEYSPLPPILWGIAAFGLLVVGADTRGPLMRLLSWRPLVRLGLISYSVYLIHEPLLRFSGALIRGTGWAPLPTLFLFAFAGAPLLLGMGALFFVAFERPFMQRPGPGPASAPQHRPMVRHSSAHIQVGPSS